MNTNPYASPESAVAESKAPEADDQDPIVLSGTVSVADVLHAQRLATRAFGVRLTLLFSLVVGLLALLLLMDSPRQGRSSTLFSVSMLPIVGITLLLVYMLSYARRRFAFNWQSRHGLGAEDFPVDGLDGLNYQTYALTHDGNPARGRRLFEESQRLKCHVCHRIGEQGGQVGPDLSVIGGKFDRPCHDDDPRGDGLCVVGHCPGRSELRIDAISSAILPWQSD